MKNKKVAIIGAGIFGLTAALEIAKKFEVVIFEREVDVFMGATYVNHYRHHMGYHYPRSPETVDQCRKATIDFNSIFSKAIITNFPCFYAIAKSDSVTSATDYLKFCQTEQLPFEVNCPNQTYLDPKKVDVCIKVSEAVYNLEILKDIIINKLRSYPNIDLRLKTKVLGGKIKNNGKKAINFKIDKHVAFEDFDYVINATYSNYNLLCQSFGFEKKKLQYELVEHNIIQLPFTGMIGLTIMDGLFPSILPRGKTGLHTLGHVESSVRERVITDEFNPKLFKDWNQIKTRNEKIFHDSQEFLPILKNSKYLKSLFVIRVVKPDKDLDDARPTEITNHGSGFYSIFGGKIITCVTTAKKLTELIN